MGSEGGGGGGGRGGGGSRTMGSKDKKREDGWKIWPWDSSKGLTLTERKRREGERESERERGREDRKGSKGAFIFKAPGCCQITTFRCVQEYF